MYTAYETLTQLLDEREVGYVSIDEQQSIVTDLKGEVALYRILAKVNTELEVFQIYGSFPVLVPEGSRSDIAEAVARANFGLEVGKFELDMDDGELRYQISQLLTDGGLEELVFDRLISAAVTLLDRYVPAVLSVIYGNELPKDAIRHVEAGPFGQNVGGGGQEETEEFGQCEQDEEEDGSQVDESEEGEEEDGSPLGESEADQPVVDWQLEEHKSVERERVARELFERIEKSGWTCGHCRHHGATHDDFRLSIGPASCVICRKCGWPQEEDANGD